jgi:hypothetical protein
MGMPWHKARNTFIVPCDGGTVLKTLRLNMPDGRGGSGWLDFTIDITTHCG